MFGAGGWGSPALEREEDLRRTLDEQAQSFRAELAALSSRVAALEAGGGAPAKQAAPAEPAKEAEPETVANLDACPVVVEDEKSLPSHLPTDASSSVLCHEEPELYVFQESMWDVQLFLGHALAIPDTAMVALYALVNIVVQIFFTIIIWNMVTPSITEQGIQDFLHWRLGEGHSYANYDVTTNTSLVRRVCDGFGANNVAGAQQGNMLNYDSYQPRPGIGGFQIGHYLCLISLLTWTITLLIDVWQTESFAAAILSLKRGTRTVVVSDREGQLRVESISRQRLVYAMVFIVAPRFFVDVALLWGGIRFLAEENTLPGLILNAVALTFILGLDEVVFVLLPRRARRMVEIMEPVEKHAHFKPKKSGLDIRALFLFVATVALLLVSHFVFVMPKVEKMSKAQDILCGGDLDFVFTEEPYIGFISVSNTAREAELNPSHRLAAVLQRTNLGTFMELPRWAEMGADSTVLFKSKELWQIDEITKLSRNESLDQLSCADHDDSDANTRALISFYTGGTWPGVRAGGFCRRVQRGCVNGQWRRLCGHTCDCDKAYLYDRQNCGQKCATVVQNKITNAVQHCYDALYRDASVDKALRFIDNVRLHLVREGKIELNGTRARLTDRWRSWMERATEGDYTMIEDPIFDHTWNLSTWLGPLQSPTIDSPCKMIPFINRIFDIDICSEVTATSQGSMRGYCPVMCRVGSCGSSLGSEGRPDADWEALERWQYSLGLTNKRRILFRRLGCGHTEAIRVGNFIFPQRPRWSNGSYTLNFCNNTYSANMRFGYTEIGSGNKVWFAQGECETRIQVAPTFDADRVFIGIEIASWPHSGPQPISALATLTCHTDGELSCPSGPPALVLEDSTVGAFSYSGASAGERIYNFPSGASPLLNMRFSTCGSQLDARLSVYRYPDSIHGGRVTIPDSVETPCPSGGGTQLTLAAPPDSHQYFLVVEGPGSSEGSYRLATDCWYPAIQCGDVVEGSTEGLPSYFGGVSGERIWSFVSSVSRTVTFDTCDSNFDSDLRLLDQQMQELAYNDYGNFTQCGYKARIVYAVAPNQVIRVLVEGFNAAAGNFSLRITCDP